LKAQTLQSVGAGTLFVGLQTTHLRSALGRAERHRVWALSQILETRGDNFSFFSRENLDDWKTRNCRRAFQESGKQPIPDGAPRALRRFLNAWFSDPPTTSRPGLTVRVWRSTTTHWYMIGRQC